jgi:hypothetical protein
MSRPHEVARFYLGKVNNDALGEWLFSQGDPVHWCAAFALQCCRESGNWVERTVQQRAMLRSVGALVNYAKNFGSHLSPTTSDHAFWRELASGRWAGVLAVFERNSDPYGHVGVVDLGLLNHDVESFVCLEGNYGDAVQAVVRRRDSVTAWVLVPWGVPE